MGVAVIERSLDILHLNIIGYLQKLSPNILIFQLKMIAAKALVLVMTAILSASLCSGAVSDCDNCAKKLNKFCCQRTKAIWMNNPGKKICCDFKPVEPYPVKCHTDYDCDHMGYLYKCCKGICMDHTHPSCEEEGTTEYPDYTTD